MGAGITTLAVVLVVMVMAVSLIRFPLVTLVEEVLVAAVAIANAINHLQAFLGTIPLPMLFPFNAKSPPNMVTVQLPTTSDIITTIALRMTLPLYLCRHAN